MAISGAQIEVPLDSDQLRKIRHGLRNSLRVRNFDEASIDRYAEEAIAKSLVEFTRARRQGKDIPDPIAWMVKVSVWRSIDLLRKEEREAVAPFSEEAASELADRPTAAPEEAALDNVEAAELHRVVLSLPRDQREALRSYYFLELSTRAAAERLHWSEPTFRRRLKAAMSSLRDRFGVPEQGDTFAIELGLAASISLASASGASAAGLGDQFVAATEALRGAISHAANRVRDLASRVIPGAGSREHSLDPAVVSRAAETASGPSGAMAGKVIGGGCAAVVAVCLASGVVGPGLGGVAGLLHQRDGVKAVAPKVKEASPPAPSTDSREAPRPQPKAPHSSRSKARTAAQASQASASSEKALGDESGTRAERTHGTTRSFGVESAPPEPVAPAPAPATSSAPASNPTHESNEQFAP